MQVYGDLIIIYPKPYSTYLSVTIRFEQLQKLRKDLLAGLPVLGSYETGVVRFRV